MSNGKIIDLVRALRRIMSSMDSGAFYLESVNADLQEQLKNTADATYKFLRELESSAQYKRIRNNVHNQSSIHPKD